MTQNNLYITQGESFHVTGQATGSFGQVIDISGLSGAATIKRDYSDSGLLDFTVGNSGTAGLFSLTLHYTGTAFLPSTILFYDVEFASGDFSFKPWGGHIFVAPEITT